MEDSLTALLGASIGLIIFVILIGQIMITNVFGEMFGVEALSFKDWLFLFVTTSPVLLIGDTLRLLKNKIS